MMEEEKVKNQSFQDETFDKCSILFTNEKQGENHFTILWAQTTFSNKEISTELIEATASFILGVTTEWEFLFG